MSGTEIKHALTISVPCTEDIMPIWPATHKGPPAYCAPLLNQYEWPRMGQLLWLDLDKAHIASNPTSSKSPPWAQTILAAMHDHGAYINDHGGYKKAFFQLQTEAQAQYTSLNAGDPWLSFAKQRWSPGQGGTYVGFLQGPAPPTTNPNQRAAFFTEWQQFWREHLHVVDTCSLPNNGCVN
jgi:hypothetical protein